MHSETKRSSSQVILTESHVVKPKFPVSSDVLETWRKGHPNFCPYKVNQKVLKKRFTSGNLLADKLRERFSGPFIVSKVHSNGVSYEIRKEGKEMTCKANHRQLKPWYEVPSHIAKHLTKEINETEYSLDDINEGIEYQGSTTESSDADDIPDMPVMIRSPCKNTTDSDDSGSESKSSSSDEVRSTRDRSPVKVSSSRKATAKVSVKTNSFSAPHTTEVSESHSTIAVHPTLSKMVQCDDLEKAVLEQKLNVCNEFITEMLQRVEELNASIRLGEISIELSSVTEFEAPNLIVHSTPIQEKSKNYEFFKG